MLTVKIVLRSGKEVLFDTIVYGEEFSAITDGVKLTLNCDFPVAVTVTPPSLSDPVKFIEYTLQTDIRNYHKQVIPDSGRGYADLMSMSRFFAFHDDSSINNIRMPIHLFTGQDHYTALAFGIVGENFETEFKAVEPEVRRALIVYMRRLSLLIKRGTEQYPIPDSVALKHPDGKICEEIFITTSEESPNESWLLTLRRFAQCQKRTFNLPDVSNDSAMYPLWCSWTDWFSDDVTDEVILNNAKEGVKLGIKNYIIDDGWFGPGLDNDFDVTIDMGDWEPDPSKIRDMGKLVGDMKEAGAVPMIWCAPHAVAPAAKCFEEKKNFLIMDEKGELIMTHNGFHCLCFMCPESREIMADVCVDLIRKWDFEGAKYDLFNCVANIKCENPSHSHDVTSMIEGLDKTLALIDKKTRVLKPDYIVELKQNYGTPFFAKYGSMMRAGDTPYNPEGNFMRTVYNQAYTPYSINDYQTITNDDSPEDAACIVLKMIAAGIPAYSIDFFRLNQENKKVIANYNNWYNSHIEIFHNFRVPQNGENSVFKLKTERRDFFFLVNCSGRFEAARSSTILNGTYDKELFVKLGNKAFKSIQGFDCAGEEFQVSYEGTGEWCVIKMLPGARIEFDL